MDLLILPIPEDIYDLDTFELKEKLEQIEKLITSISQQSELTNHQQSWLKKAKKIQELAVAEIDERKNIEAFGAQCFKEEQEFFEKLENSNPYFNQNVANRNYQIAQYQQFMPTQQQQQQNQGHNMQTIAPNTLAESHYQIDNQQQENDQSRHDIEDSTSVSSKSTKFNKDGNENKFMQQKLAIQQTIIQGPKSKNFAMQEFMRKTLQATKITDNRLQNFVAHSSNSQNYQKYVPPPSQEKQPQTSEGTTRKKKQHQSISSTTKEIEDFSHVQSKVRENIISQSVKPPSIYFSTGKAPYPKYKPPKPKKEEPKRHRLQRKLQSSLITKPNQRSQSSSNLNRQKSEVPSQNANIQAQKDQQPPLSSKSLESDEEISNKSHQQQTIQNANNNQQQNQNQTDQTSQISEKTQQQNQIQSPIQEGEHQQNEEVIIWKEEDGYDDSDSDDDETEDKNQINNNNVQNDKNISQLQAQNNSSSSSTTTAIINQKLNEKEKIPEELTKEKQINIKLEEQAIINKNIEQQYKKEQLQIEEKIPEDIVKTNSNNSTPHPAAAQGNDTEKIKDRNVDFDQELIKKAQEECEIKQIIKKMKYKVTDAIKEEQIEESMANFTTSQLMKIYQNQEINQIKNTVQTNDNNSVSDNEQLDEEDIAQDDEKAGEGIISQTTKAMSANLEGLMNSISDPTLRAELKAKMQEMETIQNNNKKILDKAEESEHSIKKHNIPQTQSAKNKHSAQEKGKEQDLVEGDTAKDQQQQKNNKISSISTIMQPSNTETTSTNKLLTSQSQQKITQQKSKDSSVQQILQPNNGSNSTRSQKTVSSSVESLQEFESQEKDGNSQNTIAKPPQKKISAPPPKQPSVQSKLLLKMMQEIKDDQLIDYSSQFPQFQSVFSGFYNGCQNFNFIETMREIFYLFTQHIERVDNVDKGLLRYKTALNPLEVTPAETYYVNDPRKVLIYQNRMNINLNKFVQNQYIQSERIQGTCEKSNQLLPHETLYYRTVKSKQEVYDIVTRSFLRTIEWYELPHGMNLKTSWNLLWTWSKPQIDMNKLLYFQKVNHFPFNKNIGRKDLLKKNIERVQRLGQKAMQAFDIIPTTFVLPKEYCNFSERFYDDMTREGDMNIWIMKPIGKSRGRGISLVNDISQVVYAEPMVVQKYLKNPLLLNGYKFDMRIYVVVTSFKPLEVFLYKDGFARMSTELFTLDQFNLKNALIHLTNYSIQKYNYDQQTGENYIGGTKITLKMLRQQLEQRGVRWEKVWTQVQEIIIKSLVACQQDIPYNPNCFELFGYDIIIDSNLRCMLLEINSSPSLARDYIIDDLVKQQLMDDIIELVEPVNFDRARLLEVLDRRIREEQGCKSTINTQNNSKLQLNRDLNYILRGQQIRKIGEMPKKLGSFERIAPCDLSERLIKLIQSYKCPTSKSVNMGQTHTVIDF